MSPTFSLQAICDAVGGQLHGPGEQLVAGVCAYTEPRPDAITFLENARVARGLTAAALGAALVGPDLTIDLPHIVVANPRVAFAQVLNLFHPPRPVRPGIHPSVGLDQGVDVSPLAEVGPGCRLATGVSVEAGVYLEARVFLGAGVRVGAGTRIHPGVFVGPGTEIGPDCVLEPNTHIASGSRLGREVYVGARCLLGDDQAGVTIADGCKLDNLVQVGGGTRLGPGVLLISQCLVRSRVELGAFVIVAAQAIVESGVKVADQVQIAGRSLVDVDLTVVGDKVGGYPVRGLRQELKDRADRARAEELVRWASGLAAAQSHKEAEQ